jgi:hypothetical protein
MLFLWDDDGIEGFYSCPRCGNKIFAEKKSDENGIIYDTRDFISQLPIKYYEENEDFIFYEFSESIKIIDIITNEIIEEIFSCEIKIPTLEHCNKATIKNENDEVRTQFRIYLEGLKKINGHEIDNTWKNRYGMLLFEKTNPKDIMNLTKKLIHEYGIDRQVKKICKTCQKEFKALISTSNFFGYDLRM